jgi:hypothetical protein
MEIGDLVECNDNSDAGTYLILHQTYTIVRFSPLGTGNISVDFSQRYWNQDRFAVVVHTTVPIKTPIDWLAINKEFASV